ncbi:hypothetical protein QYE73_22930 [Pseudomonas mosselii]|uniref:hypothetical protein n=1 Tax=Pseudomonas mosselii TaxID=78327 RepID=UPI00260BA5C7|nr:hypothetical protein [Pseudomonas mosselii]MDN4500147.1 hypothetical protein [Pseudomonas mosselii]
MNNAAKPQPSNHFTRGGQAKTSHIQAALAEYLLMPSANHITAGGTAKTAAVQAAVVSYLKRAD